VRPADQQAAVVLSDRLADLRKKERLRELYAAERAAGSAVELTVLAEKVAPMVGLDEDATLACLMELSVG